MAVWQYLKAGFWKRVPLPLFGRVPLNAAALAGFGVAGFDHPAMWAAGAVWQMLWLGGTAGRPGFRRSVEQAERVRAWRVIEERRLQLYNQLPDADRLRHYNLRAACRDLLGRGPDREPDASAELFTWLHLKLLLARNRELSGIKSGQDPDAPRLQAGVSVELTDPAKSRLADETIGLIDPRMGMTDPLASGIGAMDEALRRIEQQLADLSGPNPVHPPDFAGLVKLASPPALPAWQTPAESELTRLIEGMEARQPEG